jgi:cellulose synthase operon protein YhjQ
MSIIGIISMKGGVGKTSVTANLSAALANKLGEGRVSAVDLDPQNGLQWHLGLEAQESDGVCELALKSHTWSRNQMHSGYGVLCLPYGPGNEKDRETFEDMLSREPHWLRDQISRLGLSKDAVVLIDTPPGASVYLKQVFACADLLLAVVLADAGSYATIPSMESCLDENQTKPLKLKSAYVVNQVDRRDALNRDVGDLLQSYLGDRLAPVVIHADSAVSEALAFQQPVLVYDPHGQASHDFDRLASWVIQALNQ